jgi:ectoine hydroxylase-related dioxygenase (phytanoyl-CoA dioxygenase family)
VKATYFDKTLAANWKVPWHQDLTIAVREYRDVWGFAQWTVKDGVIHVQPPVEVLEKRVAVRFALDNNDELNGPLRVLPGTHSMGRLNAKRIEKLRIELNEAACCVPEGGALVMRPLLLHASSSMASGDRRRVIHIEFAACDLPGGLEWAA